jgi:hypothetical protein
MASSHLGRCWPRLHWRHSRALVATGESYSEGMRDPKLFLWSLFICVAWLVAATDWVRLLAVIWPIYPAYVIWPYVARKRSG